MTVSASSSARAARKDRSASALESAPAPAPINPAPAPAPSSVIVCGIAFSVIDGRAADAESARDMARAYTRAFDAHAALTRTNKLPGMPNLSEPIGAAVRALDTVRPLMRASGAFSFRLPDKDGFATGPAFTPATYISAIEGKVDSATRARFAK